MATNDFQVFAGGSGANVLVQAAYLALQARVTGFQTGIANSQQLNKVWRQASIMAAMLGQFICDFSGANAVDDGTIATLEANFVVAIQSANRIKVPGSGLTLTVATNGNDSNNGLSPSTPVQTIARALRIARFNYDTQGNPVTINVLAGTYSAGGAFTGLLGDGQLRIIGNASNQASVIITLTASGEIFNGGNGANAIISGFTLSAPVGTGSAPGDCIASTFSALVSYDHITFGATQRAHVIGSSAGFLTCGAGVIVAGGGTAHLVAGNNSEVTIAAGTSIVVNGTPAFTTGFAWVDNGYLFCPGTTITGAASGPRYLVANTGVIGTGGAGPNFFPGSIAGTQPLGGQYS